MIAVSIVSHGHGVMVERLIMQLLMCPEVTRIILTRNIPEAGEVPAVSKVGLIQNPAPKGFGANHNAAFSLCHEPFYCVLNPDIQLTGNPFPALLECLQNDAIALAAPLIVAPNGGMEDSVRRFPTLISLIRKLLGGADGRYNVSPGQPVFFPDWVAGMFMVFRSSAFAHLHGFDEGYFLYYEDVDICDRASQAGMKVALCPSVSAIHDARRDSHRSLRHLRWHLTSMARFLWRHK
jgi:N-acetylglucosaminyl-diphospho-decaprenol L-rhamnosyltransferase